jgi:hypothetical protein
MRRLDSQRANPRLLSVSLSRLISIHTQVGLAWSGLADPLAHTRAPTAHWARSNRSLYAFEIIGSSLAPQCISASPISLSRRSTTSYRL